MLAKYRNEGTKRKGRYMSVTQKHRHPYVLEDTGILAINN